MGSTPSPSTAHLPGASWFVVTFATYVALGVTLKSPVLNWIIGPLWLFLTLIVIPATFRSLRGRRVSG